MLGKLLKYDLRSVVKSWCIAMLTMLVTSFGTGIVLRLIGEINIKPYSDVLWFVENALRLAAGLGIVVMGLCFFSVFVMIFVRYFKHLFTDEGYLTFTLPVSRGNIFLSKTLSAILWMVLSHIVLGLCFLIMGVIVLPVIVRAIVLPIFGEIAGAFDFANYAIEFIFGNVDYFIIMNTVLGVSILLANSVLFIAAGYFCITLGATVVKKGKLLVSIGAFYLLNMIYSSAVRFLGVVSVLALLSGLGSVLRTETLTSVWWTLVMLIVLVAIITLCALFYCLTLNIIERKLNLS